jgi:hypothetical protein
MSTRASRTNVGSNVVRVVRNGGCFQLGRRIAVVHTRWLEYHRRLDDGLLKEAGAIWAPLRSWLEDELDYAPVGVVQENNAYHILRQVDLLDIAVAAGVRHVPIRVLASDVPPERYALLDGFWGILARAPRTDPDLLFRTVMRAKRSPDHPTILLRGRDRVEGGVSIEAMTKLLSRGSKDLLAAKHAVERDQPTDSGLGDDPPEASGAEGTE